MSTNKIKIIKSTKNIFDNAKDNAVSRVIELTNSGVIKLERPQLYQLVQAIKTSLDESFQKSVKFHEKEITLALEASDQVSKKK